MTTQGAAPSSGGSSGGGAAAEEDVLFTTNSALRVITLNRPKALNSLNLSMVRKIVPALQAWEDPNSSCATVLIKGAGGKAFCAGGDVRAIAQAGKEKSPLSRDFFAEEYKLNHLIGTYNKPYVALLDGVTMGGGVGLSVHGALRVATENTVFAMPETAIGLFPDVGGSFFLPRLDGELGMFLALTGYRLKGVDVFKSNIATHYVRSSRLPALEARLASMEAATVRDVAAAIDEFSADESATSTLSLTPHRDMIDRCFSGNSVEDIVAALQSEERPFAKEVLETMQKMSPTSLKGSGVDCRAHEHIQLTFHQLRQGRKLDFAAGFRMEYRLGQRVLSKGNDFYEGIRAVLVDKDQSPKWNPSSLANVNDDHLLKTFFAPLSLEKDGTRDLALIAHKPTYSAYPHKTSLPFESDVAKILASAPVSLETLIARLQRERGAKIGLQHHVEEIVRRRCAVDSDQRLVWRPSGASSASAKL